MSDIHPTRIKSLNRLPLDASGEYVLYWMQQSQRIEYNYALEYAIRQANEVERPLRVVFGLSDRYPEANLRHYTFMLEGLKEISVTLADIGIQFAIRLGEPDDVAVDAARKAVLVICDRGYLRRQKEWRRNVARNVDCAVEQVESDIVVPVEVPSGKREYAAYTIRKKIVKHLEEDKGLSYLSPMRPTSIRKRFSAPLSSGLDITDIDGILDMFNLDRSVPPVSSHFKGGTAAAKRRFDAFLEKKLMNYVKNRNQPQTDDVSEMSPYLHFGQISPVYLAVTALRKAPGHHPDIAAFIEELIIRRELAINFVEYTDNYDKFDSLPDWAKKTMGDHAMDSRIPCYTLEDLEAARTRDPYWNAAMMEMKSTGFMHNYMRMYWGKKILEWLDSPEVAYDRTMYLNNKYFLDGRDPNSYAGVGWIFGLHDRAWKERPIFGKIRYMAASGLERKCDINGYIEKVKKRI